MQGSAKSLEARPVREVSLCCESDCSNQRPSPESPAAVAMYRPQISILVPLCSCDFGVEYAILLEIQHLANMREISLKLFVTWILLGPRPRFVDFWDGQGIHRILTIDSGSWIGIPMPNASKIRPGFNKLDPEASPPKVIEQSASRKACANYKDVELFNGIWGSVRCTVYGAANGSGTNIFANTRHGFSGKQSDQDIEGRRGSEKLRRTETSEIGLIRRGMKAGELTKSEREAKYTEYDTGSRSMTLRADSSLSYMLLSVE